MPRITTITGHQLGGQAISREAIPYDIDLDSIVLDDTLDVSIDPTNDAKVVFNSAGNYVYTINDTTDNIRRYNLLTPYDLGSVSSNTNYGVVYGTGEGTRSALAFGSNGNYVYALEAIPFSPGTGSFGDVPSRDFIRRGALNSPYNLGTINWGSRSTTEISGEADVRNMQFSPDGTKLFIMVGTGCRYWSLSTAWNTQSLNLGSADDVYDFASDFAATNINDFHWTALGYKGYLLYDNATKIAEYETATPYAIGSISYTGQTRTLNYGAAAPNTTRWGGLNIQSDRGRIYVSAIVDSLSSTDAVVHQFITNRIKYG